MSSQTSHAIKGRTKANDIFITPRELAKQQIDMIETNDGDVWLDPCRNSADGSYYSQFPNGDHEWCEVIENKSFFDFNKPVDIICQNPPYSILNDWIKKNIELNPRVISMLIGINNLTARRIEMLENAGYGLTKMKMMKVFKWYGMSCIVQFEKDKDSIIQFDRKVWR
jgi:hypothetical protein